MDIGALVATDSQTAEAVEPGQSAFDSPSMAAQPFAAVYCLTSNARHDRRGHVAELRVRISVLNGYTALRMPVIEAVE